jgi:outer membrane receptor protein involved in Fe transport
MKKQVLQFFGVMLILLSGLVSMGQVTNTTITGTVVSRDGKPLEGASIEAIHLPSGSTYGGIASKTGNFSIPGARSGGPYRITISYAGYEPSVLENITLILGEPYSIAAVLDDGTKDLTEVVVTSTKRRSAVDRTGASTNINNTLIQRLPTINRSIGDFTRITPQANGNNFAGRDGRLNNIQIDGANLNNNFGLSTDPLPGGVNQPISIDAIDEISVNVSPFDVWQGNFTGAGINVITKSGTNTLHGSAYGYRRTEAMNGARVGGAKLPPQLDQTNTIYGATLGGAIIKNKLFFFASFEKETQDRPGILFSPAGGSGNGNVSATPVDSMRRLSNFLRERYNYETGVFDNFPNFKVENHKLLARIDWNINKMHKLTARYQEMVGYNDVITNATSVPTNPSFIPPGATSARTNLPNARFGLQSMSFYNSIYGFDNTVRSGTIELNSNKAGKWSNQFLGTFSTIRTTRSTPSQVFPIIDIFNNNTNNYMSVGYEPFSFNNDVKNNIFTLTNNFKIYRGKHTYTFGGWYEQQYVGNMFMPASQSSYVFRSLDDFIGNRAPISYATTYSLIPGQSAVFSAEMKIAQAALYAQDDIVFNDRVKMTVGLRGDMPIYLEDPLTNPLLLSLPFPDKNGNPTNYNTGVWPKSRLLLSPRVGIRWDVFGDRKTIIRGGAGIFTGRIPFVWLTNMPSNSQMYQASASVTNTTPGANMNDFLFNPDPNAYVNRFPTTAGTSWPNNAATVFVDPNFKFPQVARINAAVDQKLGDNGWSITLEGIYQKDINAVTMRNANLPNPQGSFSGIDNRPRYLLSTTSGRGDSARRIYNGFREVNGQRPNIGSAIVLENTNRGGGVIFTAEIKKTSPKGFSGSLAYNYTMVLDVAGNPGSVAASFWSGNPSVNTQNNIALAMSGVAVPHRIIASASYRFEYFKNAATTITLFYQGAHQFNFSYTYQNDLNGDGNASDLIFIPKDRSQINLLPITGTTPFTVDQQWEALDKFISSDNYLDRNRGGYAARNAALVPWVHNLDLNIQQDLFKNIGKNRHTIRFTADILNFTNMLNRDWGIRKQRILNNMPLISAGVNAQGQPQYRMQTISSGRELPTSAFVNNVSVASTWGAQIGLRYIF